MTDQRPHRVVVLALERVIPLDLAIPVQVFTGQRDSPYRVRVSAPASPVRTTAGFGITAEVGLAGLRQADTIVVPGFVPHAAPVEPAILQALRRAQARGTRLISICTGAFALAQAGLLAGRPATTHWQHVAELTRDYPTVDVRPDVLYVDDGDVLTSAGVSSGLDLCLHVVRSDHGVDIAQHVAQALVAAPHRDGNQAQFVPRRVPPDHGGAFDEVRAWILANLAEDITLDALARHATTSVRTFTRRFRESTGTTPLQWVLTARMDEARRLLETTKLPVDDVAERSGFGTTLNLRQHFRRRLDTTPTAYRRAFLGPTPNADS